MGRKKKGLYDDSSKVDGMLYKQFISRYAREYEVTPEEATRIIESVFELLKNEVITSGVASVRGFATFNIRTLKKFKFFNVRTGLHDEVSYRRKVATTIAKSFKDGVNEDTQMEVERYIKKQAVIKKELKRKGHI